MTNKITANTGTMLQRGLCLLSLVLLFSCAPLPEYARPKINPNGYSQAQKADGFSYRKLTIDDFKAQSPPTDSVAKNNHIQARSCINIRPASELKAHITQSSMNGTRFYMGSISKVRFEAHFLPHCSWWNPRVSGKKRPYVLQHEQIHFAIAELKAQELSRRAETEVAEYIAFGETREAVQKDLAEKLQTIAGDLTRESLDEHLDFDNDTSMVYAPEIQKEWLEKVEKLLQEPLQAQP